MSSCATDRDIFPNRPLVGVLGGMGPSATIDFMQKVLRNTPAHRDQDHIRLLVASIPQIPDRTASIEGRGPSPLQAMLESACRLVQGGVDLIVVPCNTAHFWHDDLRRSLPVPMLHLIDVAIDDVLQRKPRPFRIGLLATRATLSTKLYTERARRHPEGSALQWIEPDADAMARWVSPAIRAVKAGDAATARCLLTEAASALVNRGAEVIVMGCTEIPLALRTEDISVPMIDATDALARSTVAWAIR